MALVTVMALVTLEGQNPQQKTRMTTPPLDSLPSPK
jgi:hypothetical protein